MDSFAFSRWKVCFPTLDIIFNPSLIKQNRNQKPSINPEKKEPTQCSQKKYQCDTINSEMKIPRTTSDRLRSRERLRKSGIDLFYSGT
ncbi:hypothetical protein PORCRE_1958 [Porphyromonas crevioricanis JCM 15906]|uniref:Uncharacterized protein n=1 Tax=Porphyromonas crevioricanis JCM 15906 TaxID=1305617 RepID=T1DU45_9PORP|nr:hypothetical protein PORCRE_1958 [Porphyromonas crevioricanis JCM 15906]